MLGFVSLLYTDAGEAYTIRAGTEERVRLLTAYRANMRFQIVYRLGKRAALHAWLRQTGVDFLPN